jgi:2-dehydropantoate 2-reductase
MSAAHRGAAPGRIAVLGAGAMGSLFGGTLHEGGLDVTLVDVWTEHVEAINARGLVITGHGGERVIGIPATCEAARVGAVDLILVQCKAMHTAEALGGARDLLGPETVLLSFQNGLGNEELIGEMVGAQRVLAGLTAQGATVLEPGVVRNFGALATYVGELGGGLSKRAEAIAASFTGAGLETHASADIRREMWRKLLGNVGLSSTSAIADLCSSDLMAIREMRDTVHAAVEEAVAVARAEGLDLDVQTAREVLASLARVSGGGTGLTKSSACTDLRNGRRTEVDWINGAIVRLGERHGIATPVNRTLVALVKGLESVLR